MCTATELSVSFIYFLYTRLVRSKWLGSFPRKHFLRCRLGKRRNIQMIYEKLLLNTSWIGDFEREIACKILIPRSSVNYMITKYKSMKCIGNMIGRGRKQKTTVHTDRIIQRKIKTDRRKSSTSVKAELQTELNMTMSETTIRRRAHEIGLYGRVARKKPYLNKSNRGKRLEYTRTYREKPLGF